MNKYRVMFWLDVHAVDKPSAEVAALKKLKSKKVEAKIYAVEEA